MDFMVTLHEINQNRSSCNFIDNFFFSTKLIIPMHHNQVQVQHWMSTFAIIYFFVLDFKILSFCITVPKKSCNRSYFNQIIFNIHLLLQQQTLNAVLSLFSIFFCNMKYFIYSYLNEIAPNLLDSWSLVFFHDKLLNFMLRNGIISNENKKI